MLQLTPALRLLGQLFVWAKSPLAAMPLMVRVEPPLLVRVTDCAPLVVPTFWLPKVRVVGDNVTAAAETVPPVPLSDTECGLPVAESVMVMAPVRVPVADGVKVTEMLQLAPALRLLGQLFVCA
jgi:hypothetical protein